MRNARPEPLVLTLFRLAWPAILEQLLLTAVNYVDTAMVGSLGYQATAAVGGLFTLAASLLAPFLPGWLGAEPEILGDARDYLQVYAASLVFVTGAGVFSALHRCMGNTRFPLLVNLGANLAMTRVVAGLGTVSLAANQVSVTAESLCYLPAHGIAHAATALVGQSAGAGQERRALAFGRAAVAMGFLLSFFTAAGIFLAADGFSSLFTNSPETAALAARMLRIVAVSEPFLCAYLVASGVLRGGGDVRYPTYVSLIGMWLVRVPLAPVLAYGASLGLTGVWLGIAADQLVKGLLCLARVRRGRWVRL